MNPKNFLTIIPLHWTSHEALTIVRFLEEIAQAIWDLHGEGMSSILQAHGHTGAKPAFSEPSCGEDLPEIPPDDDLPF